ncbi:LysM peptidoglycan-binding domain-containing protein [Paenibacillus sp. SC116]|uniref:LysM peptidoglycan-binding domain-containing protein n=1 Tax=Paenibacillus sp. SC116 TaxID=2968986 RepID=UPI00215B193E|nr:LysM peptidoglycan-binding domain-containing protein [Paenibacillus sp. SC116]MCR8846582.1 LysM peptidoglycan-binding domain-containing protein [Paenibacillus sp. SC116]
MWYIVQQGDSLSTISRSFDIPVQTLVGANWIIDNTIYIGQRLFIPTQLEVRLTYIVKRGDTMDSIARQFGTTTQAIMQANNMDHDSVSPGQQLQIPGRYNTFQQAFIPYNNQNAAPVAPYNYQTSDTNLPEQNWQAYYPVRPTISYRVQLGDTLDSIAARYGTTKQAIMQLNGLGSENIYAGQTLTINTQ